MSKNIIAFAGSTSSTSINMKLVEYACSLCSNYEVKIVKLVAYEMPIYSSDREKNSGFPPQVDAFRRVISEADAVICSLAEHNGSYSAAFKNTIDWCSRADKNLFQEKPMLLLSTSPGRRGGKSTMDAALEMFPRVLKANIISNFSLPSFGANFADGKITNPELDRAFRDALQKFRRSLETTF